MEWKKIRDALVVAVREYQSPPSGKRPKSRQFATDFLDGLAREPERRTYFLGVRHLKLPHETAVGRVRFLLLAEDEALAASFSHFGDEAPEMVCEVDVSGGTDDLMIDRAREAAEGALGLVRQYVLFDSSDWKIYLDQVMFGLDGKYTWREGEVFREAGWWRLPRPIPMDLTSERASEGLNRLGEICADHAALAPKLRERVDTCLAQLDAAARSDRWQVIIPAIFSGMESLLVPETAGLKAGVVTVRSVAVHIAVGSGFTDPGAIVNTYRLRNDLVHGTPTPEVRNKTAIRAAEDLRRWAFGVLKIYLHLSKDIDATTAQEIVAYLDRESCDKVCTWLEEYGGSDIAAEYRTSVESNASVGGAES
jgi:hypothetical protein